jgi:hypothetical protein
MLARTVSRSITTSGVSSASFVIAATRSICAGPAVAVLTAEASLASS